MVASNYDFCTTVGMTFRIDLHNDPVTSALESTWTWPPWTTSCSWSPDFWCCTTGFNYSHTLYIGTLNLYSMRLYQVLLWLLLCFWICYPSWFLPFWIWSPDFLLDFWQWFSIRVWTCLPMLLIHPRSIETSAKVKVNVQEWFWVWFIHPGIWFKGKKVIWDKMMNPLHLWESILFTCPSFTCHMPRTVPQFILVCISFTWNTPQFMQVQ